MTKTKEIAEFGDFQTPLLLARSCCDLLTTLGLSPNTILEPTCGRGSFIQAAAERFPSASRLLAFDINADYVEGAKRTVPGQVTFDVADFFKMQWRTLLSTLPEPILIIGNPPWVTNSGLGVLKSTNLPKKSNFQNHLGLDALTGKSNFDISEWMLMKLVEALHGRRGTVAMLCKTAVARKVLQHAWKHSLPIASARIYAIDAPRHFGASVDACFLVCALADRPAACECAMFDSIDAPRPTGTFGYRNGRLLADLNAYDRLRHLDGNCTYRWRSGIKHDCRKVMEFTREGRMYRNGLAELVDLEDEYLFPMLKGSEVANGKTKEPSRWMLVTQKNIGAETAAISGIAPKTWDYLTAHASRLDGRASVIYRDRPRFSVFGVGEYTFSPWKVAICGFYKKLEFAKVAPHENKPTVLDDTCYFLSCQCEKEADYLTSLLNSDPARQFLNALTFWDAKRPITIAPLSSLDIEVLAREMGCKDTLDGFQADKAKRDRLLFQ